MKTRKWISALMAGFLAMCMLLASCAQPAGGGAGGGGGGGSGYTPPTPATPESKVVGTYIGGSRWYIFKSGGKGSVLDIPPSASIRALAVGDDFTWEVTGTSGGTISVAITIDGGGTANAEFYPASGTAIIDGVECTKQGIGGTGGGTPEHEHNYEFVNFTWTDFTAVANYRCTINGSHTKTENAKITYVMTKNPTASETGIRTYTAEYDGHFDTKTQTIPVLRNDYVFENFTWTGFTAAMANYRSAGDPTNVKSDPADITSRQTQAPTCTGAGIRKYTATSGVNYEEKEETLPPLGHDYVFRQFTWDPNGLYEAYASYTCSRVTSHRLTPSPKATITSQVTKAPTYTETGIKTYTATYDGHTDTKTEVLPKLQFTPSEGLVYKLSSDGTYYILSDGKNCQDTQITIPATYIGKPVKEIGANAFGSRFQVIVIPDSVTSIGKDAVSPYNTTLKTIHFIGDINDWVMIEGLGNLMSSSRTLYLNGISPTSIEITTATKITANALLGCGTLTSVTIGSSVKSIGAGAFKLCSELTKVTINNGAESIGNAAFSDCSKLTSVTIDNSVTSIVNTAFENCPIETAALPSIAISAIPKNKLRLVNIRSGDSIGEDAFSGCTELTTVTIGTSVTSIGESAFKGCSALTRVTIPNRVESIGNSAFENCSVLTTVTIGTSVKSIGISAFRDCTALEKVSMPTSVESIGNHAFRGCSALTSVTIGTFVTSIGEYAFSGCSSLTSIVIPDSVTSMGESAFSRCTALTSVKFGSGLTRIEGFAFSGCSSLTSIVIPDTVTSVGHNAFDGCPIETATLPASVITALSSFPKEKLKTVTITSGDSIGENAFSGCTELTSVTISGVKSIEKSAFRSCYALTSVNIGTSVKSIGDYAFCDCSALTSVNIGTSVTSIGESAFKGCSALTKMTIGKNVASIGTDAFRGCTALTNVVIPNSVTSIGENAFHSCTALPNVEIPNSVTNIGNRAFYGCNKLATITYTGDKTQWANITKGYYWNYDVPANKITLTSGGTINL